MHHLLRVAKEKTIVKVCIKLYDNLYVSGYIRVQKCEAMVTGSVFETKTDQFLIMIEECRVL